MAIAFPGESAEYRAARNRLLEREIELRRAMEAVAAARRGLPPGGIVPQDYIFQAEGPGGSLAEVRLSELFTPGKDSLVIYTVSGTYQDSMAALRAMYYVFASEHYGLPYLASVSHQAVERKFPNYFRPSVREKLYQQLALALRSTVDKVAKEFDGPIVFVPPFSALVLNRASTPAEIPSETLALRAE